jgi:dTDP-4-dehydrorhamnose reductase
MRILITGADGQLGKEARLEFAAGGDEVIAVSRKDMDLANPQLVADAVADYAADWVVNCAAYTQVDKAEDEAGLAFKVNRDGARAVAEGAGRCNSRVLHLSTDYIFAGDRSSPYGEKECGRPLGVYGRSKWEGEQAVRELLPEALIVRTAWVYGVHGDNFVKTMLRTMAEREELRIVDDQLGSPSWTADIVRAMRTLIAKDMSGTWNFTNEGVASWYDFAHEIISIAARLGHENRVRRLLPIPGRDYPCAAKRPQYSVLSKEKIRRVLGYEIPHWRDSLHRMLADMPV